MRLASIIALLLASTPCAAQVSDPFAVVTDPADRAILPEVVSLIANRKLEMAPFDALLVRLPRPTALRGIVQMARAQVMSKDRDTGPAVAAMEEALRLLPDEPRPKLVATWLFTFAGAPARAADLWILASRESPELARFSDPYLMDALVGRLNDLGDRARADRLRARLGEIGFTAGLAPERSSAALARTREAIRDQREDVALQTVTTISDPDDLLNLFVDRRYAMLWPRIAEWAGADLGAQTRRYLEELRGDWTAANDFRTATPYARQLFRLHAHAAVAGLFLPMFDRLRPDAVTSGQTQFERLAPILALSLARLGRKEDALAVLGKAEAAIASDDGGNALNIDGAYLSLAADELDWAEVIARADIFLTRAKDFGAAINRSALIQVQARRACALWHSGREADAQQAAAPVLLAAAALPGSVMDMHLCRGDAAAARTLLGARLADEATRDWALRFVQPTANSGETPLARRMEPVAQAVRTAPEILAAIKTVGRLLPQPVNTKLPEGFDPFRAMPRAQPLERDAT